MSMFLGRSGVEFTLGLVVGAVIALLVVGVIFTELGDMLQEGSSDLTDTGERRSEDLVEHRTKYPILQWQNIHPKDRTGDPPDDATAIESCQELQNINEDLGGNYYLENDIDCSGTKEWNNGDGFEPIGDWPDHQFKGELHGQGHKITDLHIDRSSQDAALFAHTNDSSEIKNLELVNVSIRGEDRVAALIGVNWGDILNSRVRGKIITKNTASDEDSFLRAGGLVAYNDGKISSSSSSATIDGHSNVGGLVGYNSGDIFKSYSSGNISGEKNNTGGLVGSNSGIVLDSYSTGHVNGNGWCVGGLVGYTSASGIVYNAYSTGQVTGGNDINGLIGYSNSDSVVGNSFWNYDTAGITKDPHGGAGTPKKTEVMESKTTYTDTRTEGLEYGWDFEHTWTFNSGRNYTDVELKVLKIDVKNPKGGYTVPSPGITYVPEGEEITLKAHPDIPDWSLDKWTGDERNGSEELTVEMDGDKEITAEFTELSVNTECYDYVGDDALELDPGNYEIEVYGADGGDPGKDGDCGEGGYVQGAFTIDEEVNLNISIGNAGSQRYKESGGYGKPDGGDGGNRGYGGSEAGGGGGSTELWLKYDDGSEEFLAAAGGGGGAGHKATIFEYGGGGGARGGDGGWSGSPEYEGDDGNGDCPYDNSNHYECGGDGGDGVSSGSWDQDGQGGGWEANGDILDDIDGHRGDKGSGDEDGGEVCVTEYLEGSDDGDDNDDGGGGRCGGAECRIIT
ncbi:MAG: GLUG motif-containing protein [Candidatus Aenigmatarchaeota archaeon]